MNKKGISPLIATVLIIGFTVALAAIIITWGGQFIDTVTESTSEQSAVQLKCGQLQFVIGGISCSTIRSTEKILTNVKIKSNTDIKITGIRLRAIDKDGQLFSQAEKLTPELSTEFGTEVVLWETSQQVKNPKQVQAIATIIDDKGVSQTCAGRIKEYNIRPSDNCGPG